MPWVRLDEEFPDHPKVVTAGPLASWLHVCALAYCNRYLTDGFVSKAQVRRLADFENIVDMDEYDGGDVLDAPDVDPYKLAEKLVRVGMWEQCQGGYRLHNYHEYQPSRAEIEAQRKVKSEAGRLGGKRSGEVRGTRPEAEAKQTGSRSEAEAKQTASTPEAPDEAESKHGASAELPRLVPGRLNPDPVPDTDTEKVKVNTSVALAVCEPQALTPDRPPQAVVQVFETWLAVTGRTNQTLLDAKRRRLIDRALKDYPLEDVLDAVAGWRRSPHHRGENDSRTVYNDLELLLRDAAHLEKFRDLERQAPSTNGTPRVTAGEQAIDRVFAQLPRGAA